MTFRREARLQALFCGLAVVLCDLASRPFTTMSFCDDGPYIRMAHTFANTGHIVYNGWGAAMMTSQLCIAAVFIKLFGFSTTSVRMSTLLLAVITAYFFHRTLIRMGASSRNATLGTLAVVISPLYLMLSPTFMTDIDGLFATTLCLYGCIRAIQASEDRSAIGWIFFAVITCAFFGTSRQIAWLGDLVMVPSTVWLLRSRRRVLVAGSVASVVAFLFILGCTHWLSRQPYIVPVPLIPNSFPKRLALKQLSYVLLELPFLLLPVAAVFIPRIFKRRFYVRILLLAALVGYVFIAFHTRRGPDPVVRFEPTAADGGSWVNIYGTYTTVPGTPIFLDTGTLVVLTTICIAGLLGIIAVALEPRGARSSSRPAAGELSWKQLGILLLPFCVAYLILLEAAVGTTYEIFDRYALSLLGPAMIVLIRLYQERVQPRLPVATVLLIVVMAAYGVVVTHNSFALNRAKVDLANELHASGVPYTEIDGGWDYNVDTELDNSDHINSPHLKAPADAKDVATPAPAGYCQNEWYAITPHIHALYGISFLPNWCYGEAPFAPIEYRRWPLNTVYDLYAVRYAPPGGI